MKAMAEFTVKVSHAKLDLRLEKIETNTLIFLRSAAETLDAELVSLAKAGAPVKSGKYQRSIRGKVTSSRRGVVGRVYSRSPLAHIIEAGAHIPAHEILPKVKQALHFGGGAGDVFAARVELPGATLPSRRVIQDAFDAMRGDIVSTLESAVRRAARES